MKPSYPFLRRGVGLLAVVAAALPSSVLAQESVLDADEPGPDATLASRPSLELGGFDGSIDIDGRLSEEAWRGVPVASSFVQGEPVEGIPAEEDTEVRMLIDGDALYVAARMYDSEPSSIGRQLVRRDEEGAFDWFAVALDPNLDRRTGYAFQVSAAGVQSDEYLYDDQRADQTWDAVWESAVRTDSLGWIAEIRIPLSQIRYEAGDDPQTWGVNFARKRLSSNELSYFALKSRRREGLVSQFGTLEDVRLTSPSRRIEVRPYVLSSLHQGPAAVGDPFFDGSEASARMGADVSVGVGSAFTLDATVNPDFGQVEADPAVINLSAFETRQDERRPFFVEDAQVFDFSLASHRDQLFYSRRIGRNPSGGGPAGADHTESPDAATILGAAKFTGRTTSGLSIGVLGAVTQEEHGEAFFADERRFDDFMVEPRTAYSVVRLQQDLNGGASQVGGIVTALRRDLPDGGDFDWLTSGAYTAGLGFEHQWNDRDWKLGGFFVGSHVRGDSTALIRVQRASNHYFQRPDAEGVSVDSTASGMTGGQWRLTLSRQNTEHLTGAVWMSQVSEGFEVNDLGFSQGGEKLDGGFRLNWREITPGRWFRSYNISLFGVQNWSHEALEDAGSWSSWQNARTGGSVRLNTRTTLDNYWGANVNVTYTPDAFSYTATRGGPVMKDPGHVSVRTNVNTDRRKAVSFGTGVNVTRGRDGAGENLSVDGSVSYRPSSRLEIEVEPSFRIQKDGDQYITSTSTLPFEATYGRRYLFGELDRKSVSMETRVNWTFTPTLSFQLYAQPLISSGEYTAYKQLLAPRTFDFDRFGEGRYAEVDGEGVCDGGRLCTREDDDGGRSRVVDFDGDGAVDFAFGDRDFNIRSLVGNAVVRWEYRPGSTIFFVWQRRQAGRSDRGDFRFDRDLDALLGAPADDRFIIKVNYWLGL